MTNQQTRKRFRLEWFLYPAAVLLLIWVLYSATMRELARTPIRDAAANLGQYGFVTIRFSTDPFPPLPTGTTMLSFQPTDSLQRTFEVDQITYEYGPAGSEQAAGSGVAQLMSDGSGTYMGSAQFFYVGNWWVKAKVSKAGNQADVRFSVYVEPAQ
jgi:hypothetical protein